MKLSSAYYRQIKDVFNKESYSDKQENFAFAMNTDANLLANNELCGLPLRFKRQLPTSVTPERGLPNKNLKLEKPARKSVQRPERFKRSLFFTS